MTKYTKEFWQSILPTIREQAKTMTAKDIAKHHGIGVGVMYCQLRIEGIKTYNPQDKWSRIKTEVQKLAKKMNAVQLAEHYSVSHLAMLEALRRLKIKPAKAQKISEESKARIAFIKKNSHMNIMQLAKHFGVTHASMTAFVYRYKLKEKHTKRVDKWRPMEDQLRKEREGMTIIEMARKHGVSFKSMIGILKELGINGQRIPAKKIKAKKPVKPKEAKKPAVKQTKKWEPPKKDAKQIIIPDTAKIIKYDRPVSSDHRCLMALPVYKPSHRPIYARY